MNKLQLHRSSETKKKISDKLKNRSKPDYVKKKISETMKRNWQIKRQFEENNLNNTGTKDEGQSK